MDETHANFDIEVSPAGALFEGTSRFDFTKQWSGGITGTSRGTMLSGGDPISGTAGYVALEVFEGVVAGVAGGFALQQFGTMVNGDEVLHYEVVPGSGVGDLGGITGRVDVSVEDDEHLVVFHWSLSK